MVSSRVGVCTHTQSEQYEALCVGTSHHYWSGREGVVIRTTTTTPSCPDHYCSSYKTVLLHTAPLVAESYNYSYGDYCIIRHSLRCLRPSGVSFTGGTPFALSLNAL